jgi:hypothetical protein
MVPVILRSGPQATDHLHGLALALLLGAGGSPLSRSERLAGSDHRVRDALL